MDLLVDAGRSGILWLLLVYVAGCQWVWHMMVRYAGVAYDGELSVAYDGEICRWGIGW